MWKETLLQGLISLLPVFLFLVWYDRPSRARAVPFFLGVVSSLALFLETQLNTIMKEGIQLDFRLVPLFIGALYGGVYAAGGLSVLYAALSFANIGYERGAAMPALFLLLFVPVLLKASSSFRQAAIAKRRKIVIALCTALLLFGILPLTISYRQTPHDLYWQQFPSLMLYYVSLFAAMAIAVYFMELAMRRVNVQRAIRENSRKFRNEVILLQQFLDQAPMAVVFLDRERRVTHINDYCMRGIHPVTRDEVLGRSYDDVLSMLDEDISNVINKLLQGKERVADTFPYRGRIWYTVASPVRGLPGQSPDGILFIAQNVTELQRLKDEVGRMERLSLVGQMAASITHEIRNPMAVIRGFVQLLNERSPADQRTYFQIVMDELDRANGIINDFLSLAQNRIVEKELCSLHDVLHELLPLIQADANMRGQIVELRLCEEEGLLEINSKEIKQLVLNLARNGMEAMGDKGVLTIETVNLQDAIQLRVADRGVGIPPEKLQRLFEPFYTTKSNGTGLGLALCLSIVERHHGTIRVESTVGAGTTFIVTLGIKGQIVPA